MDVDMDENLHLLAEVELACSVPTLSRIKGGYHIQNLGDWVECSQDLIVGGGLSDNVELIAWGCDVVVQATVQIGERKDVIRIRPSEVVSVEFFI